MELLGRPSTPVESLNMLPNLPVLSQYQPPPTVLNVTNELKQIEAERQAEEARIAQEAIRLANEEAERRRMEAVWLAHPAGNNYTSRNCTWGVANWTKVPIGLGHAKFWYSRAEAWGFPVGTEPRVGAVGVVESGRWGHVVWVTALNPDGTITIKEQNYNYRGAIRTKVVSPGRYRYIYFE